jgi:hypothetical protein
MSKETRWRIAELLGSGYDAHQVAKILDVPFQWVVFVGSEGA